jgi:hypothetical protein
VLITETGAENLSRTLPMEMAAIEKVMAEEGSQTRCLLVSQRVERIDAQRPQRGNGAGHDGDKQKQESGEG